VQRGAKAKKKLKTQKRRFKRLVKELESESLLYLDEDIENYEDKETSLRFKCKHGHINYNSMSDILRKRNNGVSFCLQCSDIESMSRNIISRLQAHNNFRESRNDRIYLKNGWCIDVDKRNYTQGKRVLYCNAKTPHKIETDDYNLNYHLRQNSWECEACAFEEKDAMIKEVLGEEASYRGITNGSHRFHCAKEGHPDFTINTTKFKSLKKEDCCSVCYPRSNTQKRKDEILRRANALHKKYSKCDQEVYVFMEDKIEYGSRESIAYKCCHKEHLPFFVSYDNMREGKENWCAQCKGKKPRKNQIEKVKQLLCSEEITWQAREMVEYALESMGIV